MNSMSDVNRLKSELYECHTCERTLNVEDVENTWKCPDCKIRICIYGEDKETNTRITLERKRASEIETKDLVHLHGGLTGEAYSVLGISKIKNNKLGLGLKGWGRWIVHPDETINCRTGSW